MDWVSPDFGTVEGVTSPLIGSTAFSYDDTSLTNIGIEYITTTNFTSLILGGLTTIGLTTFNTSNTGVELAFSAGNLIGAALGGTISGVGIININTDDFWVNLNIFNPTGIGSEIAFSTYTRVC
jgi:hypothetical protein